LEHLVAWTSNFSPNREHWFPPPPDSFKINFDTAIRDEFSSQAAICRNSNGKIIKILAQIKPTCSPAYGEAQAALLASFLAVPLNFDNFVLERDSATVIIALQDHSIILDWQHDHIICNIFFLLFQSLPLGRLEKLAEVQTSAPITWQIGPQLDLFLTAFPPYLLPSFHSYL
jgi:hypothetical protein